jgi:hypothetical protein
MSLISLPAEKTMSTMVMKKGRMRKVVRKNQILLGSKLLDMGGCTCRCI